MVRSIWCTNRNFQNFGLNKKRPKIVNILISFLENDTLLPKLPYGNPLLSTPRGGDLFILSTFERGGGGLIEKEGLFNLETTIVSVLHKE